MTSTSTRATAAPAATRPGRSCSARRSSSSAAAPVSGQDGTPPRAEGAEVILSGRDPGRLERAATRTRRDEQRGLRRQRSGCSCSASSRDLPARIDHLLITAGGPQYGPMLELARAECRRRWQRPHVSRRTEVARQALPGRCGQAGTLLLMGGTGGRQISREVGIASAATAVLPPSPPALELAPIAST